MESVLHKRYKIGERLFSNACGELFLGRDLQANINQRWLIHYLPQQLLSDSALKQSLSQLQSLSHQAETTVLKVLDCAWSETEVCFVLEMPEAWSLSPLPAIHGQPTNLHQKALAITQQLIDQGLVTTGIEPSLFLVTPTGDLYLLGTALLAELQTLTRQSPNLLQPKPPPPTRNKHRFLPVILWAVTGLVAAASLGIYQVSQPIKPTQAPVAPKIQVSRLDKPLIQPAATTSLVTLPMQPNHTPIQPLETSVTPVTSAKTSPATPTLSPSIEPLIPETAPTQARIAQPALAKPSIIQPRMISNPEVIAQPVLAKPSIIQPTISSNPAASRHLERATAAIKQGHLQTGLYYLRLAKKLEAHPEQLKTTTQQLLEQAQHIPTASETLSPQMQTSIKHEFGLE